MPFAAPRRHQYWSVDVRYIEDHALGTGKPVYVISVLENFSRALLASAISPRQDLTAFLIVLRAAVEAHGAPRSSSATAAASSRRSRPRRSTGALGIAQGGRSTPGQAWQNYIETHFNVMRRMADHDFAQATTWAELQAVARPLLPQLQPPAALRPPATAPTDAAARPRCWAGCRGPGATRPTSTGSSGCGRRACSMRGGYLRFRHWRLYGERGLAGERAAVWVWDETLTIEYAARDPGPVPGRPRGGRAPSARGRRAPALRHRARLAAAVPAAARRDRMAPGATPGALPAPSLARPGPAAGATVRGQGRECCRRVSRLRGGVTPRRNRLAHPHFRYCWRIQNRARDGSPSQLATAKRRGVVVPIDLGWSPSIPPTGIRQEYQRCGGATTR